MVQKPGHGIVEVTIHQTIFSNKCRKRIRKGESNSARIADNIVVLLIMQAYPYKTILFCILLTGVFLAAAPVVPADDVDVDKDRFDTLMEGFEGEDAAPDDGQLDEVLSGFEEESQSETSSLPAAHQDWPVQLDGYVKIGGTWNFAHDEPQTGETDWRGLSRLRAEAQTDLLIKWHQHWRMLVSGKVFYDTAYALRGRDEFTDDVIDAYESESEWRELYLQGRLGSHLDLKLGRQIVVWGRSDNLRVTDVLNPLDLREPGLTDIEDLRLPVAMSRADGYFGPWNLTGIAIHEIRFDKNPVFGHDFFPGSTPLPREIAPSDGGDDTEWAAALNGIFSGKDISLYWANLFDDTAHVANGTGGGLVRKHPRVSMWGAAGNLTLGNWLLKSELAYWRGLRFFNTAGESYQRLDALIGMEYSGWDETTITVEGAIRHLIDFDERLASPPDFAQEDENTYALRLTRNFMNETVELTLLLMIYGPLGQDGGLERMSVAYDWNDAISITAGVALYQSGDQYALRQIGDNDRVYLELKYSF
jgi:hypothetical protein